MNKMIIAAKNYLFITAIFTVMLTLTPNKGLARHVSIGRWILSDCFAGQTIEIFRDNTNYAVSIIHKDNTKELRPITLQPKEADGSQNYVEHQKETGKEIRYTILPNKTLEISLDGTLQCSGNASLVKSGSPLN